MRIVYTNSSPEPAPLKPDDAPPSHDPADDFDPGYLLAAYFKTAAYKREVKRQRASATTAAAMDAELVAYWAEGTYGHASNLAR